MIHRISVIAGWLALGMIAVITLSPIGARPSLASPHLEHFAAFALIGFAFALAYPNRVLLVFAIVVGAALGLEALQLLTPVRPVAANPTKAALTADNLLKLDDSEESDRWPWGRRSGGVGNRPVRKRFAPVSWQLP